MTQNNMTPEPSTTQSDTMQSDTMQPDATRSDTVQVNPDQPGIVFQHAKLDNGLVVIGEHNPRAQSVAAGYFVNTGARDEQPEVAGVSHFLEHMMFKGTFRRSPEDINREFDELGANYNAYTSEERTVYYGAVLSERSDKLLDLLTDMMRPSLRVADFDLEKNVILEEIAMYEDRPNFKVFEIGNERYYRTHPLGNSVLGSPQSITDLTQAQMQAYFEARYAPNNMLLSIAGNYDWDAVLGQVATLTQTWQPFETARRYPDLSPQTGPDEERDAKLNRAHVAFFAPGVSAQSTLRYAAAVLANAVGDSSGSRLYWEIVDKGLADSASLSHDSADRSGAFVGYLSTAPEALARVRDLYLGVLTRVETDGVSADEWARAQRKLATSLTLRGETPFGRLMSLGSAYLYTGEYQSVQDVVAAIFAASLADAAALLADKPFAQAYSLSLTP